MSARSGQSISTCAHTAWQSTAGSAVPAVPPADLPPAALPPTEPPLMPLTEPPFGDPAVDWSSDPLPLHALARPRTEATTKHAAQQRSPHSRLLRQHQRQGTERRTQAIRLPW